MAQQHVLFQGGVAKFNRTVVKFVCRALRGLSHLRKYDFLNIVKTYIPLRFKKKNIINFYFYYWFTSSDSEKHWKTLIELCACARNICGI